MRERAGLLVRAGEELGFVPANTAQSIVALPAVSPVAHTPLAMTLLNGRVVPVVALGSATGVLVLCELDGEPVGFSGLEPVRVGLFTANERGVIVDGHLVLELDLASAWRSLEPALEPQLGEI